MGADAVRTPSIAIALVDGPFPCVGNLPFPSLSGRVLRFGFFHLLRHLQVPCFQQCSVANSIIFFGNGLVLLTAGQMYCEKGSYKKSQTDRLSIVHSNIIPDVGGVHFNRKPYLHKCPSLNHVRQNERGGFNSHSYLGSDRQNDHVPGSTTTRP